MYLESLIILFIGIEIGMLGTYIQIQYPLVEFISVQAPSDYINRSQIEVYQDKFCVLVNDSRVMNYAATGSMIPVLNENANGIEIQANKSIINIGDIVAYENDGKFEHLNDSSLIIHRVINKKIENGIIYYLMLGDNNFNVDGWINESRILWKTISIIY